MTTQKQLLADRAAQLHADREALLTQPAFLRVMADIMASTHPFETSYCGEMTHAMVFKEGMKNVGLQLLAEFSAANGQFLMLLKQHALPLPPNLTPRVTHDE